MSEPGAPVMAGAEPWSAAGGPGAVLVLHGFTGSPQSMRPLAEAVASLGVAVELPLLPGHGTAVDDMMATGWDDWSEAAERAYLDLAARHRNVAVVGLSMGGTLACWLASRHPDVAGLAVVNPLVEPPAESFLEMLSGLLDSGVDRVPGIGSDIALEGVQELSYDGTPVGPALSLFGALDSLVGGLGRIRCPALVITSRQDHVVPPSSSDVLADKVSGPIERIWLDDSYHVATLDHDRPRIEAAVAEFVKRVGVL